MAVALVTGAAQRIGRVIAITLAKAGYDIALHYRNSKSEALSCAEEIEALNRRVICVQADLLNIQNVQHMIRRVRDALGTVTLLVNNASIFEQDSFQTVTRDSWQNHLDLHGWVPIVLSQELSRHLPPSEKALIINMVDQRVSRPTPAFFSYTASKSLLWSVTQTMAMALAPRIRVNAIAPGPALPSKRQTQKDFDNQVKYLPLRKGTTPQDIAEAILYLVHSTSITGQILYLDGGQHLAWETPDFLNCVE